MSLTKTLQQSTGVDATFWQVTEVITNTREKIQHCRISGFKDQASYDAGFSPLGNFEVAINQDTLTTENNTTFMPALKASLKESQALCKLLVADLSDAVEDDTDVI